ncbi:MAG: D-alanine--D-alanine ligase [Phycisphaerae bacterium]|nr:D-alanine--D-alanine ligase [Phycisphaerae bacterium]
MKRPVRVLVLGGGPDAEREVSIKSATGIADALRRTGRYDVRLKIITRISPGALRATPADVIFPYLHGPWGEGGPLQDILEADGRPFVGSGAAAARLAMDKMATKGVALAIGIPTPPACILNTADRRCPLPLPVVVKPVHEGSTIGLRICESTREFAACCRAIEAERSRGVSRSYMVEPRIAGAELTVGVIGDSALPVIRIVPRQGLYDYKAKYIRNDTRYIVNPPLPGRVLRRVQRDAVRLAAALGCRHISRTDYMLARDGTPWLLEINTTPGFTDHSLVPKAARAAGIETPDLCDRLVRTALRDRP